MKKLSIVLCFVFIMSACSSTTSKVMRCTSSSQQEQMESSVTMEFTYESDIVLSQKNETQFKTTSADLYDQINALVQNSRIIYSTINGATYDSKIDEENKTIKEEIKIDFAKISKEDKQKILSYEDDEMNVNTIKEILESQSFTCTK